MGVGNQSSTATVDIYDDSTETWSSAKLSVARGYVSGATIGKKGIFCRRI